MTEPPVLTVSVPVLLDWEQHRPGGCRCLCPIFHRGPAAGGCTAAAEPAHLIRVETPDETSDPRPVCSPCYTALASPRPDPARYNDPPP